MLGVAKLGQQHPSIHVKTHAESHQLESLGSMGTLGFVRSRATHGVTISKVHGRLAHTRSVVAGVVSYVGPITTHWEFLAATCWRGVPCGCAVEPRLRFRFPTRPHLVGRFVSLVLVRRRTVRV